MTKKLTDILNGVKRVGVAAALAATAYLTSPNYAEAQTYNAKKHDTGAKVVNYKPKASDESIVEAKTWGKDKIFLYHIDEDKYDDDLDISALRADSTTVWTGLTTEKTVDMTNSEGSFAYKIAKDHNGKPIKKLTLCYPCNDYGPKLNPSKLIEQIKSGNLIPNQQRFILSDGRVFWPLEVPNYMKNEVDEQGRAKYLDHVVLEINPEFDNIKVGQNPRTGAVEIVGDFYRPTRENSSGQEYEVVPVSMTSEETFESEGNPKSKGKKKSPLDLILGVNSNKDFTLGEVQAGLRIGHLAFGINAGKKFDKKTTEVTTPQSQITGNYGQGKIIEENKSIFGPFAELHLAPKKSFDPFVSGGVNFYTNELKIIEGIKNSSGNWKPGSPAINSKIDNEKSYRFMAGAKIGKLRLSGGFDTLEGAIGNISVSLPIYGGKK